MSAPTNFPDHSPAQTVSIDYQNRLIYARVTHEQIERTVEYVPGVNVDLDAQGRLVGIELFGNVVISVQNDDPLRYDTYKKSGVLGTWKP